MPFEPGALGLVHDYLLVLRGAERTFLQIARCWPEAPIYTTLFSPAGMDDQLSAERVHASPLQRLRISQRGFRRALPLYPWAVGRLPVSRHRVIVSSSSAFAHGIRPAPGATHVCYCHTPFRYVWHERDRGLSELARPLRPLFRRATERMRRWDLDAASRVTAYIANSELTRQRIGEAYGRDAEVIHPPVAIDRFSPDQPGDYFLLVSELVPHKRVDLAIEAARRARVRLLVVGEGPDAARLRRIADSGVEFRGRVEDRELAGLYARCRAAVIPNVEEFGIVAVECQAAGRPVVAVGRGGARETVVDGETGVLVEGGSADELAAALAETDFATFSEQAARRNAERFAPERFRRELTAAVERISS